MDDFWALWQARVAANAAAIGIAKHQWEESLIFSKTYRNRIQAGAKVP
jgi:hypothetical protein